MGGKAALAYSGGLDSTLVAILLKEKYGFDEIIPVLVDVGQGAHELNWAKKRTEAIRDILGADPIFIDAKKEFVTEYIHKCIKANGLWYRYPMGTSMTRVLIAQKISEIAKKYGADAVAHGCTGKGNDQYRMETTFAIFAPEAKVIAPVRELNLSRVEEEKMLEKYNVPVEEHGRDLGDDINMWSRSIGSGEVESLSEQHLKEYIWAVSPEEAPEEGTNIEIDFEKGIPVCVRHDGDEITDPVDIIMQLNEIGGEQGVGRIDIMEAQMMALKSRELMKHPPQQF